MTGTSSENGEVIGPLAHVFQSIADILGTPKGTRVLRRDYGSELIEYVGQPLTAGTIANIVAAVAEALGQYEPRFEITQVKVVSATPGGEFEFLITGKDLIDNTDVDETVQITVSPTEQTVADPAPDYTPDGFAFTAITEAVAAGVYTSDPVTLSGIDAGTPISVGGGSFEIGGNGNWLTAGTVASGDTVRLRATAPVAWADSLDVSIVVGTAAATWTISTAAAAPAATLRYGEHQRAAAGGYAVTGTAITSDTSAGQFTITAGRLVPAQDGLTVGSYDIVTDAAEQLTVNVEAATFFVRTDAEIGALAALPEFSAGGATIVLQEDNEFAAARITSTDGYPLAETFVRAETADTRVRYLSFKDCANITIDGVHLYDDVGTGYLSELVSGENYNITYQNCIFEGLAGSTVAEWQARADGFRNVASGTFGVQNLAFLGCTFRNLLSGISVFYADGLTVDGCVFEGIYIDNFHAQIDINNNVRVTNNTLKGGLSLETDTGLPHADYAQFSENSGFPDGDTRNWLVAFNRIWSGGARGLIQSIFGGAATLPNRVDNFVVAYNTIIAATTHGIWLDAMRGLQIFGNSIVGDVDKAVQNASIQIKQADYAQIVGNTATYIYTNDPDNTNVLLSDNHLWLANDRAEYQSAFMGTDFGDGVTDAAAELLPRPGGPLDQPTPIGAGWVTVPTAPGAFTAPMWTVAPTGNPGELAVDIFYCPLCGGELIDDLQVRLDGGAWASLTDYVTGQYLITGLTDGQAYVVELRAGNMVGYGPGGDTKAATPASAAVYAPSYVTADGVNDYMQRTMGDLANSATVTLAARVNLSPAATGYGTILHLGGRSLFRLDAGGTLNYTIKDSANTVLATGTTTAGLTPGTAGLVVVTIDLNAPGDHVRFHLNGTEETITLASVGTGLVNASNPSLVGEYNTGNNKLAGDIADLYWSDAEALTAAAFTGGADPVDPSTVGTPKILIQGTADVWNAGTNAAGADFTVTGSFTDAGA